MLNKILCVILLGVITGLTPAQAQTPAATAAPARVKGRIIAARVEGHVEATLKAGGAARVLHDGDALTDETTVVTSAGANVILVFSNGATVNVAADSTLDIEKFEQDPFSADLNVGSMTHEEGTSTTRLNLASGELVGKVVHLNVDKGSEFTVQTPVGAAGIRGTTFKITFRPGKNGKAFFVVTTSDGVVVFRGLTSSAVTIPKGKTVVATFDYTPPTGGAGSGGTGGTPTGGTPTGGTGGGSSTPDTNPVLIVSDVTVAESLQIEVASQSIVTANQVTTFVASTTTGTSTGGTGTGGTGTGGTGGSGSGGSGSGTTPTVPVVPPPLVP